MNSIPTDRNANPADQYSMVGLPVAHCMFALYAGGVWFLVHAVMVRPCLTVANCMFALYAGSAPKAPEMA